MTDFAVLPSNFSALFSTNRPASALHICLVLILATPGCSREPTDGGPISEDVAFRSVDGVALMGTVYPVEVEAPPGLVLVHMLGSTRRAWQPLAAKAQQLGMMSVAFDMRGHGDSVKQNDTPISYKRFGPLEWRGVLNDIDAAKKVLLERGADPNNIIVIGASIGANLTLLYALDHDDVQGIVLLSPGLAYRDISIREAILGLKHTPSLLMASEGDAYSAASVLELHDAAPAFSELRTYKGGAHGTDLIESSESAMAQVFQWIEGIVPRANGKDIRGNDEKEEAPKQPNF